VAVTGVYVRVIYVLFTKVISQGKDVLDDEDHKNRYGSMYEGYKTSHWIHKSFFLFEVIRRLLFVLFLVFLAGDRST